MWSNAVNDWPGSSSELTHKGDTSYSGLDDNYGAEIRGGCLDLKVT